MLTRSKARQMRAKAAPVAKKAAPVAKKAAPVRKSASKKASKKKRIACFRKTRKFNTAKGKAGSKYTICLKSKKSQKGGFVRARSVQQFVQSLFQ